MDHQTEAEAEGHGFEDSLEDGGRGEGIAAAVAESGGDGGCGGRDGHDEEQQQEAGEQEGNVIPPRRTR